MTSSGPPPSKADYAYDTLLADIRGGRVEAGQPLRATEVAGRLGVSITPVREALRRLQRDGLVSYEAHHGATVVDLGPQALAEFYAVRAALEGLGARLAADRVDHDQLAGLRELHARMSDAFAHGEADGLAAQSEELHLRIAAIGGPEFLGRHTAALRHALPVPPRESIWHDRTAAARHLSAHEQLLDALAARDGGLAEQVMAEHIRWSAERRLATGSDRPTEEGRAGR